MVTVSFPEVLGLIWELTKKTEAADLYNPGEIPLLSRLNRLWASERVLEPQMNIALRCLQRA